MTTPLVDKASVFNPEIRLVISYPTKITDAELLWKSAEHWLENFQLEDPFRVDTSSESCPCCQTYFNVWSDELPTCGGCPIFTSTGHKICSGTPYWDVQLILRTSDKSKAAPPVLQNAIAAEYEFLVSLALSYSE